MEEISDYYGFINRKEIIINFIVLKNSDLVFWTYKKIYFYKLSKKEYILYQTIDESIDKPEKDYKNFHSYLYR